VGTVGTALGLVDFLCETPTLMPQAANRGRIANDKKIELAEKTKYRILVYFSPKFEWA
jgi:hypothetical protein